MRKICTLIAFALFILTRTYAQPAESHNFTTYDTVISISTGPYSSPDLWNVRISRPINMFTPGNADTASRPAIIMMPGIGEQGVNDPSKLMVYGPHYWLANGWDGGVTLGNGKHYPILITVSYVNNMNPTAPAYYNLLTILLQGYHIKRNSVHVTGLSQGAFTNGALILYEATPGDETGMKLVTSACLFEGTPDPLPLPYAAWSRGFVAYQVWATKYKGHYFYLEGSGSDNFRDGWQYANAINAVAPGSAYFSYETLGGGSHCCWNSMYDPSATNWTSVGVLGPNNGASEVGVNTMGNYHAPSNVFQWMLQQGDTSLVGSAKAPAVNQPPVANAGGDQTVTLPAGATLSGSGSDPDGTIAAYAWTETGGPTQASISNTAIVNPAIGNLAAGVYTFQLKVTDNSGATATDNMTLTVKAAASSQSLLPSGMTIPGRIEAESFTSFIGVQTQLTDDIGAGLYVGWIYPGDWMSYNVTVTTAGTFTASFRVATPNTGAVFQLRDAKGNVLANVPLSSTGGWDTWQTVTATVTLPAGNQTLQLVSTGTDLWNINWMEFDLPTQPQPSGKTIPGKIESENYDASFDVAIQPTPDLGGGSNVGWIYPGSWMSYKVNVTTAGSYTANFRIATPNPGAALQLRDANGNVLANVTLPSTGSWSTYQTVTATVTLPAGNQTLQVVSTGTDLWNINWMEFDLVQGQGSGKTIPGKIESENYDAMLGVQTQATTDAGGGLNVGWIDPGDWMSYNVNVTTAGAYLASFRVSTLTNGSSFQLQAANGAVLATLTFNSTGGFQVFQTISAIVNLPAGNQTLKIVSTASAYWNINWMEFDLSGKNIPGQIEAENYDGSFDVAIQPTPDIGGGSNVGWIYPGSWMSYNVNVAAAGTYTASFRIATPNPGAALQVKDANGNILVNLKLPSTGSWDTYQTVTANITLPAGSQTLQVVSTGTDLWNINWMAFTNGGTAGSAASGSILAGAASQFLGSGGAIDSTLPTLTLYPNPATDQAVLEIDNPYTGKMLVQVVNTTGVVLRTYQVTKDQSYSRVTLSTGDLSEGVYFIRVQVGNWTAIKKLLKR